MTRFAAGLALVLLALGSLAACGGDDVVADSNNEGTSIEFKYTIATKCPHPGEKQAILARTEPGVNVGYAVLYADGKPRGGNTPQGTVGKDGRFGFSWEIPEDAPPGPVRVTLLAAAGQRTGSENVEFVILPKDQPCSSDAPSQ